MSIYTLTPTGRDLTGSKYGRTPEYWLALVVEGITKDRPATASEILRVTIFVDKATRERGPANVPDQFLQTAVNPVLVDIWGCLECAVNAGVLQRMSKAHCFVRRGQWRRRLPTAA